jgi:glycosyltransferase involved in cell wall biosynthesis/SAM-dependent methyltransferase
VRFLFISHYFYPEVGAPQTRILETAQRLSAGGHEVSVLTGFPNYPDGVIPLEYRRRALQREQLGDIRVIRSLVYPSPNSGFARRLANHASFALSSLLAAPLTGRPDVIVAETPPLFSAVSAVLIARSWRVPLLLNVADLWPESAVQLGMLSNRTAIRAATILETFAYRHAAAITVPTAGMRATLLGRGEPEGKVVHLPNAVDVYRFDRGFADAAASVNAHPRVIYCGTVGLAQGVGTIVDAAAQLHQSGSDLEFLIVGDGAERQTLARQAAERGLSNVRFAGRVPRDEVPGLILSADVAVLSLRDVPLFEDALPTKMLEYMAAGLPVVASASGDVSRLLSHADAGLACPPADVGALVEGIRTITQDRARGREMGANGRRYVHAHYSREAFVRSLERVAVDVTGGDAAERERVKRTYGGYAASARRQRAWSPENAGNQQIVRRLYDAVRTALMQSGTFPSAERSLLDIGCGSGDLLRRLLKDGAPAGSLVGVDVLPERIQAARQSVPGARFEVADARTLPLSDDSVDAAILSTVFSSIVKPADRGRVAAEALRVLRPGGVILSYDLRFWSPGNPNVRPIGSAELERLFPGTQISTQSMTLLPPLARRLGRATELLYSNLVAIPMLRTHLFAAVAPQ